LCKWFRINSYEGLASVDSKEDTDGERLNVARLKVGKLTPEPEPYPYTPGMLYEYQNKGLANWAIRKCMKRKEADESGPSAALGVNEWRVAR
jgi:hypothetical protein